MASPLPADQQHRARRNHVAAFQFRLSSSLLETLHSLAKEDGCSAGEYLRTLIRQARDVKERRRSRQAAQPQPQAAPDTEAQEA